MSAVTASPSTRRIVALFCLAAILLLSLGQGGHGLPVAILAPFWIVLAIVLALAFAPREEHRRALSPAFAPRLPSRAPPVR